MRDDELRSCSRRTATETKEHVERAETAFRRLEVAPTSNRSRVVRERASPSTTSSAHVASTTRCSRTSSTRRRHCTPSTGRSPRTARCLPLRARRGRRRASAVARRGRAARRSCSNKAIDAARRCGLSSPRSRYAGSPTRASRRSREIAASFADYDLLTYSSAIAFQVLYVVVPLGLLALAGLGLVGEQSLYTDHIAPTLRARPLARRVRDRESHRAARRWTQSGSGGPTAVSSSTLWGAGAALRSMMTPLNAIYGARETRSWLERGCSSRSARGAIGIVVPATPRSSSCSAAGSSIRTASLGRAVLPRPLDRGARAAPARDRRAHPPRAREEAPARVGQRRLAALRRLLDRRHARLRRLHQRGLVLDRSTARSPASCCCSSTCTSRRSRSCSG